MKAKATKRCKVCGSEFRVYRSTDKFCSYQCASTGKKIKRIRRVSEKKEKENRTYTKNRLELIQENIKANGFLRCERCGDPTKKEPTYKEECHHIIFRSEKPSHRYLHSKRNLIILCAGCHEWYHAVKGRRNAIVEERKLYNLFGNDIKDK